MGRERVGFRIDDVLMNELDTFSKSINKNKSIICRKALIQFLRGGNTKGSGGGMV